MSEPDNLEFLHRRLLEGDPTASERLVQACLTSVVQILRRRHIALPREAVEDAAHDALLALIRHPERYDPKRATLLNYLVHIAARRLIDWLRARQRQQRARRQDRVSDS